MYENKGNFITIPRKCTIFSPSEFIIRKPCFESIRSRFLSQFTKVSHRLSSAAEGVIHILSIDITLKNMSLPEPNYDE